MAFDDLPPQPPIFPAEAEAYARQALERSRLAAERTRRVADVAYGPDYWQKIDIYLPDTAPARRVPVLLFAHGGAWTHGYKEWCGLMAPALVSLPAIFVSVSYRLAPDHRYPVPMDDCRAALAWVWRHIADYGGAPDRIYVGGHSAGGHLYSLVALRHDLLRRDGLPDDVVKACFPVSAQMNLVFKNPAPGSGEERIYKMFLVRAEDAIEASPITHVSARTPFFLAWGENDFPRIIRSNEAMLEALRAKGGNVSSRAFPGLDHFEMALDLERPSNGWVSTVRSWISRDN